MCEPNPAIDLPPPPTTIDLVVYLTPQWWWYATRSTIQQPLYLNHHHHHHHHQYICKEKAINPPSQKEKRVMLGFQSHITYIFSWLYATSCWFFAGTVHEHE